MQFNSLYYIQKYSEHGNREQSIPRMHHIARIIAAFASLLITIPCAIAANPWYFDEPRDCDGLFGKNVDPRDCYRALVKLPAGSKQFRYNNGQRERVANTLPLIVSHGRITASPFSFFSSGASKHLYKTNILAY